MQAIEEHNTGQQTRNGVKKTSTTAAHERMSAGSPAKRKMSGNNQTSQSSTGAMTKAKSSCILPGSSAALRNSKKMYNNYILSSTLNLKIKRDTDDKPKFSITKQTVGARQDSQVVAHAAVVRAFTPDNLIQSKLSIPVNKISGGTQQTQKLFESISQREQAKMLKTQMVMMEQAQSQMSSNQKPQQIPYFQGTPKRSMDSQMTASLPNHIPMVGKDKTPVKYQVEKINEADDENIAAELSSNMKQTQPRSQVNLTNSKDNASITSNSRFGSKITTLQVNSKLTLQPTMQMSKLTANKNEQK